MSAELGPIVDRYAVRGVLVVSAYVRDIFRGRKP
jgi:hypothetical protein